jgi:hypothetical protein
MYSKLVASLLIAAFNCSGCVSNIFDKLNQHFILRNIIVLQIANFYNFIWRRIEKNNCYVLTKIRC